MTERRTPEAASPGGDRRPTVVAFYLPQFHPVPENDAWWGKGFTEWTNVVKAKPLFDGHQQPHLPADLGFYDLRVPEVREQQATLARTHGIDAFCYYHYWFGGRRVLGRPLDEVLRTGRPDLPFCLCWANENWTRAWDAGEHEILLAQEYNEVEQAEHLRFLVRAFSDPRHLRVDDRPVFLIYRAPAIPHVRTFVERLREASVAAGAGDPYVVKCDTHLQFDDPADHGCDAAAEFPPHGMSERNTPLDVPGLTPGNVVFDYGDVAASYLDQPDPPWVRHKAVFPSWDNTSRRGDGRSIIVHGSTPEAYEGWLREVCARARRQDGPGLVFVNAWNEWAEGAHLEPDERHGRAYLRATARAVLGHEPPADPYAPAAGAEAVLLGPRFSDLYLDLYERYVRLQRRLTATEAMLQRHVQDAAAVGEAAATAAIVDHLRTRVAELEARLAEAAPTP